jgi:hypothetical protein
MSAWSVAVAVAAEIVASTAEVIVAAAVAAKVEIRSGGGAPDDGKPTYDLPRLFLAFRARHELENIGHRHALIEASITAGAKVFVEGQTKTPWEGCESNGISARASGHAAN